MCADALCRASLVIMLTIQSRALMNSSGKTYSGLRKPGHYIVFPAFARFQYISYWVRVLMALVQWCCGFVRILSQRRHLGMAEKVQLEASQSLM